jgi:hypothetical protein
MDRCRGRALAKNKKNYPLFLGGDERACFEAVWGSADWCEGMNALLAKMKPVFGPDERGGKRCDFGRCVQKNRPSDRGRSSLLSGLLVQTGFSS